MFQILNAKKDAVQKPVLQRTPQEEQTRALTLRLELLEERVAPTMFNPKEY
jgi:hypothetical protein